MSDAVNRRDLLTKGLPAGMIAGLGLASLGAAQEGPAAGARQQQGGQGLVAQLLKAGYDGQQYKLPKLPYDYDALEPSIDAQTMRLHHDAHHQAYVDGLNKALKLLEKFRQDKEPDGNKLAALQRDLTFNGSGHVLHTIFWATMAPDGESEPKGEIARAIEKGFGSFDSFKSYFSQATAGIKGSGWGILAYEPVGDNLIVTSVNEHDVYHLAGMQPLLPIDVWEHAYYLKYQNKRAAYIDAWFNVINWPAVDAFYQETRARFQA